jgi:hypothetical protein
MRGRVIPTLPRKAPTMSTRTIALTDHPPVGRFQENALSGLQSVVRRRPGISTFPCRWPAIRRSIRARQC